MVTMDEDKARKWMGLTQQQWDIVKIIYRLNNRGATPSPKNIQNEYGSEHKKHLMKPNLFHLLRQLIEKQAIKKEGQGKYIVDEAGLKKGMDRAKVKLERETEELNITIDQVDQFFKQVTYMKEQPGIQYMEGPEFHEALAESVEGATILHLVANFPVIAYSREITHALGREQYAEILWQKCLRDKQISVNYLTDLSIHHLFHHCFRTHGDPRTAYRECHTIIERLKTQLETHKNLDIRFMGDPHGLDVAIIETTEPVEFTIFIRDEHGDIQGGIRVRSRKTSTNALKTYMRSFEYATPLTTPQGMKQIDRIKETLTNRYGVLG